MTVYECPECGARFEVPDEILEPEPLYGCAAGHEYEILMVVG